MSLDQDVFGVVDRWNGDFAQLVIVGGGVFWDID